MQESTRLKVEAAQELMKQAFERHGNKIYSAFSGGKDSKAVLKLARSVNPNVIVIHNTHNGEDTHGEPGVLAVKGPKDIVPLFLKTVELEAQFDGTRQDEDKEVVFDGEYIHRSKMTRNMTEQGLFGLTVYFPLYNFTEEEVYEYLQA